MSARSERSERVRKQILTEHIKRYVLSADMCSCSLRLSAKLTDIFRMATKCPLCGKKSMMANKRKLLRGHYNPVNRYRKYPNLQWAKMNGKRVKICTSCIKRIALAK